MNKHHRCDQAHRTTSTITVGPEEVTYEDRSCSTCGKPQSRRIIDRKPKK